MIRSFPEFQVFVKPVGSDCNLDCRYCYYHKKGQNQHSRMPHDILERYIVQHIEASVDPVIFFSWHGGEPTLAGLDFFRELTKLQRKHVPSGKKIINGIQTNGYLLNDEWCSFFAAENFSVGISLDGPASFHDIFRTSGNDKPTFKMVLDTYFRLRKYNIPTEILCVVSGANVFHPSLIYRFFKEIGAGYITFLPLVVRSPGNGDKVSPETVNPSAFGNFLCEIFDEWVEKDIGKVKVQIFEEAARTAFKQDHTLCIFKETCGGVPVMNYNGDFYSCDHYVKREYLRGNITTTHLADMLESQAQKDFGQAKLDTLPAYCISCEVKSMCNGECPRNRFIRTPDGEPGLNYLCPGYKKFFNHCMPFITALSAAWQVRNQ